MKWTDALKDTLRFMRRRIMQIEVGVRVTVFLSVFLLFTFGAVLLDHAFVLSIPYRKFILFCIEMLLGGFAFYILFFLLFRRIMDRYIARLIENYYPEEFRESLATAVEAMERPGKFPYAGHYVGLAALRRLEDVEVEEAVSVRALNIGGLALIGTIVVFFSYAVFSGKSVALSLERIFSPEKEIAAPTSTRIEKVIPGDGEVFEGDDFKIAVELSGKLPEFGLIHYTYDGVNWKKTALAGEQNFKLHGFIRRVQMGFKYYVTAGDAESDVFKVRSVAIPVILSVEKKLTYPSYTRRAPEIKKGGDVEAVVGTKVEIRCKINNPVSSAEMVFPDGSKRMRFLDENVLSGAFEIIKDGKYSIKLVDERGRQNKPVSYQIVAIEDLSPFVRIVNLPKESAVTTLDDIPAAVEAKDDYGLKRITLNYYKEGQKPVKEELFCHDKVFRRVTLPINPGRIGVTQGDVFYAYAEAADINPDSGVSRTPTYKFVYYPENWARLSKDFPNAKKLAGLLKENAEASREPDAGEQPESSETASEGQGEVAAQKEAAASEKGRPRQEAAEEVAGRSESKTGKGARPEGADELSEKRGPTQPSQGKDGLQEAKELNERIRRELARDEGIIRKMKGYLRRNYGDRKRGKQAESRPPRSADKGAAKSAAESTASGERSAGKKPGETPAAAKSEGSRPSEAAGASAKKEAAAEGESSQDMQGSAQGGEKDSGSVTEGKSAAGSSKEKKKAAQSEGASEASGARKQEDAAAASRGGSGAAKAPGASESEAGQRSGGRSEGPSGKKPSSETAGGKAGPSSESEGNKGASGGRAAAKGAKAGGGASGEPGEGLPVGAGGGGAGGAGYKGASGASAGRKGELSDETAELVRRALENLETLSPSGKVVEEFLRRKGELEDDESFLREVDMTRDEVISFARKYEGFLWELSKLEKELSSGEKRAGPEDAPYSAEIVKGRGVDKDVAISAEGGRGTDLQRTVEGLDAPSEEKVSPEYEDLVKKYFEILSRSK